MTPLLSLEFNVPALLGGSELLRLKEDDADITPSERNLLVSADTKSKNTVLPVIELEEKHVNPMVALLDEQESVELQ